jgi:DNA-binding XRE family transcriptional regulator
MNIHITVLTCQQIRGARAMLGLTQAGLGQMAGLSKTAITNIERGKSDAKGSTLRAIQKALEAAGAEFDTDGRGVRLK